MHIKRYLLETAILVVLYSGLLTRCNDMYIGDDKLQLVTQSYRVDEKSKVARIDGDLILGGLFTLHRRTVNDECGLQMSNLRNIFRVEAMVFAIHEINNDSSILPGLKLGAEIRDDCYSSTIALEQSLDFILNALSHSSNICKVRESVVPPVIGVVGTVSSRTTMAVASLLRLFRLPQISYGATSPDLNNRNEYQYFMRTLPSDEYQARALIDVTTQLNWSAVFLMSSVGNYGQRIREKFVQLAKNHGLCIVDEMKVFPQEKQEIIRFFSRIEEQNFMPKGMKQSVRGLVLLTESRDTVNILNVAKSMSRGKFDWLATDTWGVGQDLRGIEDIADGAISIALHNPSKGSRLQNFYDYMRRLKPESGNTRNPWFNDFWRKYFNNSEGGDGYNMILNDDKIPYVFDAVYAFAHGLHAMLNTTNSSLELHRRLEQISAEGKDLLNFLMKVCFEGKSGRVSFDVNGNGLPRYDVMRYRNKKYEKIAFWNNGKFLKERAWFKQGFGDVTSYCGKACNFGEGRYTFQGYPSCCWYCKNCSITQYVDSQHQCQSCAVDLRVNMNKTGCVTLPEHGAKEWVIILLTFWGALGLLVTSFVAYTMYRFYSTPLIMASGRELMLVLLAGIALSFCLGFLLLGSPSVQKCMYQRFGSGVFLAVCYSAILVKTNRIARIFRGKQRPAFITPASQLLITSLLVSVQLGICVIALFFGTASELTKIYEHGHSHTICRTSGKEYVISISYNVMLLLFCTVHAFLTRKLPANFNEARIVGITMYTTCVQWICFIPLFYGTHPVYQTSVLLLNSCFSATVLLVGMFARKVHVVWFRPEKNTHKASNPRGRMESNTSGKSIEMDDNFTKETLEMRHMSSKVSLNTQLER